MIKHSGQTSIRNKHIFRLPVPLLYINQIQFQRNTLTDIDKLMLFYSTKEITSSPIYDNFPIKHLFRHRHSTTMMVTSDGLLKKLGPSLMLDPILFNYVIFLLLYLFLLRFGRHRRRLCCLFQSYAPLLDLYCDFFLSVIFLCCCCRNRPFA